MSYAAENHSTKLLHSFYDAVVRYKLKSNLAWFYFQYDEYLRLYTKNVEYTRHIVFKP